MRRQRHLPNNDKSTSLQIVPTFLETSVGFGQLTGTFGIFVGETMGISVGFGHVT
jgi:hypothetical protein